MRSSDLALTPSPWIRSGGWDSFWMLSGFWVPTLFVLLPLTGAQGLILGFTLLFWIAHRLSSVYLALCVAEYREVVRARKGYFFALPMALLAAVMVFLLLPESLLPMPRLGRVVGLMAVDYFFSLYHFAVQHYGVLSVYRGRLPHGQKDPGLLRWDWWICIGVSGILTLAMDYAHGELNPFGIFGQQQPELWAPSAWLGLKAVLSCGILLFWALSLRLYQRRQQGLARMLYLSTLCYMTLISLYVSPLLYFAMAQIQHWLVSLGLSTHMARNSRQHAPSRWYRSWSWVNGRALGPLVVLVLLSLALTPLLEADYYLFNGLNAETLTVKDFLTHFQHSIWLYVFGGLAFFSSFVHYIYDRGVFRFADPLTRKAALALLRPPPVV
ncbi:MAG: hypothetical protein ACO1RX_20675 [Candidatus Sericytochromatia bacterium]